MVEIEYTGAEVRESGRGGVFGEAVGNDIVGALMQKDDVVSLVEPADVVVLYKYVPGFASDGGGDS